MCCERCVEVKYLMCCVLCGKILNVLCVVCGDEEMPNVLCLVYGRIAVYAERKECSVGGAAQNGAV